MTHFTDAKSPTLSILAWNKNENILLYGHLFILGTPDINLKCI